MKYPLFVLIFSFITSTLLSQDDIKSLLPDPFNLPGMQANSEPRVFEGDYLFDLINGGADVYFEYGFNQVVTQSYSGMDGKSSIKVEIYQMTDTDAAYGILSLSTSGKHLTDHKGAFSVNGSAYKMISKGQYFIMITYVNISDDLKEDMIARISTDIESKIKELANYPSVVTSMSEPCPNVLRSLYFKGDIALRNATYIDFKIPFKYVDGIFFRCDVMDYIVFIPEGKQAKKEVTESLINSILNANTEFTPVKETFGFSIKEQEHLKYEVLPDGDRIVLIKYH